MYDNKAQNYLQKQIETASPAQRVVMMYDGAIKFYSKAKQAIEAGDIEARFNANTRATDIIVYLLETLDIEKGGDVAKRLNKIYFYILKRQMDIDIKNDPTAVDEIVSHLRILRKSWEEIARKGPEQAQADANGESSDPKPEEATSQPTSRRNAVA